MSQKKKANNNKCAHPPLKNDVSWIKQVHESYKDDVSKKKLRIYLQRFVSESEAIDATRQTNGFITDLNIYTTVQANAFLEQMCFDSAVKTRWAYTPNDLAKAAHEAGNDSSDFIKRDYEFALICLSTAACLNKRIAGLSEFKPGAKTKTGRKRQNKSSFRRLDAVFRHLRNAFAHGQYLRVVKPDGSVWWALQDANGKGNVTARMLLKEDTLDAWVNLLSLRDKRYRDKSQ